LNRVWLTVPSSFVGGLAEVRALAEVVGGSG